MDAVLKWVLLHTAPSPLEGITFQEIYSHYVAHAVPTVFDLSYFIQRLKRVHPTSVERSLKYLPQKQLRQDDQALSFATDFACNGVTLTKEVHCAKGHVTCRVLNKEVNLESCGLASRYNSLEDLTAIVEGVELLRPCSSVGGAKSCSILVPLFCANGVCDACRLEESPENVVEQMLALLKQCPLPDGVAEFLRDQIIHSVRKFGKWSPRISDACASWYEAAPSVYKTWRQRKLLLLPHPRSLKSQVDHSEVDDHLVQDDGLVLRLPVSLVEKMLNSEQEEELKMVLNESQGSLVKVKRDTDICSLQFEGSVEDIVVRDADRWLCSVQLGPKKSEIDHSESGSFMRQRRTKTKKKKALSDDEEDDSFDVTEVEEEEEGKEGRDPHHRASCELCGQEFVQKGALASHVRWQHRLQWSSYHLAVQTYTDKDQLKSHLEALVKEAEEVSNIKCPACSKPLPSISQLHDHVKEHDVLVRKEAGFQQQMEELEASAGIEGYGYKVKCPFCERTRSGMAAMKKHLTVWHSEEDDYTPRRAAFFNELKRRKKEGPLECWRCGESCHGLHNLSYHVRCKCLLNPARTHYHHCAKCRSKFSSKEALQRHMATRHLESGKEYQCDQCGKSYAGASGLSTHRRSCHSITDKTPIRTHVCPHCNKAVRKLYDFKRHLQSHSSQKTAPCNVCGKLLKSAQSLQRHKAHIHLNQYPYKCQQCGHGVSKRAYLLRHKCGIVKRSQPKKIVPDPSPPPIPDLSSKKPIEVSATFEHSAFAALENYLLPGDSDKLNALPNSSSLLPYTLDSQVLSSMFPSSQTNDILMPTSGPSQLMEGDLPPETN